MSTASTQNYAILLVSLATFDDVIERLISDRPAESRADYAAEYLVNDATHGEVIVLGAIALARDRRNPNLRVPKPPPVGTVRPMEPIPRNARVYLIALDQFGDVREVEGDVYTVMVDRSKAEITTTRQHLAFEADAHKYARFRDGKRMSPAEKARGS